MVATKYNRNPSLNRDIEIKNGAPDIGNRKTSVSTFKE